MSSKQWIHKSELLASDFRKLKVDVSNLEAELSAVSPPLAESSNRQYQKPLPFFDRPKTPINLVERNDVQLLGNPEAQNVTKYNATLPNTYSPSQMKQIDKNDIDNVVTLRGLHFAIHTLYVDVSTQDDFEEDISERQSAFYQKSMAQFGRHKTAMFWKQCFSIDVEFDKSTEQYVDFEELLTKLNDQMYEIIDGASIQSWKYATVKSDTSLFLKPFSSLSTKDEGVLKREICNNKSIQERLYVLLNDTWSDYDVQIPNSSNYVKTYLIEFIGAVTNEELYLSGGDYTYSESRYNAYLKWMTRKRNPITCLYTTQYLVAPSLACENAETTFEFSIQTLQENTFEHFELITFNNLATPTIKQYNIISFVDGIVKGKIKLTSDKFVNDISELSLHVPLFATQAFSITVPSFQMNDFDWKHTSFLDEDNDNALISNTIVAIQWSISSTRNVGNNNRNKMRLSNLNARYAMLLDALRVQRSRVAKMYILKREGMESLLEYYQDIPLIVTQFALRTLNDDTNISLAIDDKEMKRASIGDYNLMMSLVLKIAQMNGAVFDGVWLEEIDAQYDLLQLSKDMLKGDNRKYELSFTMNVDVKRLTNDVGARTEASKRSILKPLEGTILRYINLKRPSIKAEELKRRVFELNVEVSIDAGEVSIDHLPNGMTRFYNLSLLGIDNNASRKFDDIDGTHILTHYGSFGHENFIYSICSNECRGTLYDLIAHQQCSFFEIITYLLQACKGLLYCNKTGILHNNFTENDLLIGFDGRAYISNFENAIIYGCGTTKLYDVDENNDDNINHNEGEQLKLIYCPVDDFLDAQAFILQIKRIIEFVAQRPAYRFISTKVNLEMLQMIDTDSQKLNNHITSVEDPKVPLSKAILSKKTFEKCIDVLLSFIDQFNSKNADEYFYTQQNLIVTKTLNIYIFEDHDTNPNRDLLVDVFVVLSLVHEKMVGDLKKRWGQLIFED